MSAAMRYTWSMGFNCDAATALLLFTPCSMQPTASESRKPSSISLTASASEKLSTSCGKAALSSAVSDGLP